MSEKPGRPLHILKGSNHFRYLSIGVLIVIAFLGVIAIPSMGYIMVIVILIALLGLLSIRFPYMYLLDDHFIIEKKSVIKILSDKEVFSYEEIEETEFFEGSINWAQMIFQSILGTAAAGGFSKPDLLLLKLRNNQEEIIYRFGKREAFREAIIKIQNSVKPST